LPHHHPEPSAEASARCYSGFTRIRPGPYLLRIIQVVARLQVHPSTFCISLRSGARRLAPATVCHLCHKVRLPLRRPAELVEDFFFLIAVAPVPKPSPAHCPRNTAPCAAGWAAGKLFLIAISESLSILSLPQPPITIEGGASRVPVEGTWDSRFRGNDEN
jgi:hypothetical protein